MKKVRWKVLAACFAVLVLVMYAGSRFTSLSVPSSWYDSIKPSIAPPGYVIGIVWTVLYVLIALSLYFAWIKAGKKKKMLACVYGINLDLNMLWSFLFFGLRNPIAAFGCIILMFASTTLMIKYVLKIDKRSAYLLLPYLLWIGFASVLNYLAAF